MNQKTREQRRAAAREFLESLEQLGRNLNPGQDSSSAPAESRRASQGKPRAAASDTTIRLWEDAAADIEQFMQARQS
jgi:hypothetical protein